MVIFISTFGPNKKILSLFLIIFLGMNFFIPRAWSQGDEISLQVNFIEGGDSLDFGRLRNLDADGTPTSEAATRQVRINVDPVGGSTNAYIVTQIVQETPVNEVGTPVPLETVLYRVQEEVGSGVLRVPNQTPLVSGEEEIYRSASTGGSSQLLITYDLTASPEQEAGSYSGSIAYRVSAI